MLIIERHIEQLVGLAPIASIQSGTVYDAAISIGTTGTESARYHDVTILSVDLSKSFCAFDGKYTIRAATGFIELDEYNPFKIGFAHSTCYLLDETTLRLCSRYGSNPCHLSGVWWVIEYA